KAFVRYDPSYDNGRYYRQFVLEYLRARELEAGSSLVRVLKTTGQRVVSIKDLNRKFPKTKKFLLEFSQEHPGVLKQYREHLAMLEQKGRDDDVDEKNDPEIAGALATALKTIVRGAASASEYHDLMIGIVEFIFYPTLIYPRKELEINEGRKRIDIAMD